MDAYLQLQAEFYLRLHLHAVIPMHSSLVDAMCRSPTPPLELATTLEDIGQAYLRMAEALNGEIIRRDLLDAEPEEPEDFAEARIHKFATDLVSRADILVFYDGMRIDGRAALEAAPIVGDVIKSAVLLARAGRRRPRPTVVG